MKVAVRRSDAGAVRLSDRHVHQRRELVDESLLANVLGDPDNLDRAVGIEHSDVPAESFGALVESTGKRLADHRDRLCACSVAVLEPAPATIEIPMVSK